VKKILKILIPLAILGILWYQFGDLIRAWFLPCREPIAYTLGIFDTKFGISKSYFLDAVQEAEMIWEKPFEKELFVYKADSKADTLKINLVYDYRQQATSKLADIGIIVKDNRASYDSLKIKFTELKKDYEIELKNFNQDVQAFNKGDRNNQAEFNRLQEEQKNLKTKVEEINAMVVVLNRLVATLNLSVETYNTVGATRGESFEEGVYVQEGLSREIDIYEFSSREKLVRVLAHELGHALGLDHVNDSQAIMYELNQGNNKTLTEADLEALKTRCGLK